MTDLRGTLSKCRHTDIEVVDRARKDFDEDKLWDLALDILKHGMHNPITVLDKHAAGLTDTPNGVRKYKLLAGERRYRATQMYVRRETVAERGDEIPEHMKLPSIKVYQRAMSEKEMALIELGENLYRKDFTFQEQALLTQQIHETLSDVTKEGNKAVDRGDRVIHTRKATAKHMGKSAASITTDLAIAKAIQQGSPELKEKLARATNKEKAVRMIAAEKKKIVAAELARRLAARAEKSEKKDPRTLLSQSLKLGNFDDLILDIPDRSIDFVELDPDYGFGFKENAPKRAGGTRETASDYVEIPPELYEERLGQYLKECYRVMKDNSWIIVWYAMGPWHEQTRDIIEKAGFFVNRIPALWNKLHGNSAAPAYVLGNQVEYFFYARKGNPRFNKMGQDNVFTFRKPTQQERFHPAEKPVEFYNELLEVFCRPGSNILVPFSGSGNCLLASANKGCQVTGFEISKPFYDRFQVNVNSGEPGRYKTYKS